MNIVNIINFVRAVEPRVEDDSFLPYTLEKELELCGKYGYKNTVLLQYDALIRDEYLDIISKYADITEVGLWLEIVEPLVRDSGMEWRGRFPWDWHNDVGFTVGYDRDERKRLVDTAFAKFREIFGCYPESVGSWHIDAFTLGYMYEKYGIKASCNCRDQYGTDGYTIWGGYYAGAYYPSKKNMLCPANTAKNQINVPVFRMLGSDPVYQYDMGLGCPDRAQGVVTLEPVYEKGGGSREWVEWYFRENFNGKGLSLSYTQMGQENSFGWDKISKGLPMQFEVLKRELDLHRVTLMTLGEAGKLFAERYKMTPVSAVCTDTDIENGKNRTVWYNSRFYRANIFFDGEKAWIRDIHIFDENYEERFLYGRDADKNCGYFNLPVTDGFRFSRDGIRAGIYVKNADGSFVTGDDFTSTAGDNTVTAQWAGVTFLMKEKSMEITVPQGAQLVFSFADVPCVPYAETDSKRMKMHFDGYDGNAYDYETVLSAGSFTQKDGKPAIIAENGKIKFEF